MDVPDVIWKGRYMMSLEVAMLANKTFFLHVGPNMYTQVPLVVGPWGAERAREISCSIKSMPPLRMLIKLGFCGRTVVAAFEKTIEGLVELSH